MKKLCLILCLSILKVNAQCNDTELVAAVLIKEAGGEKDKRSMAAVLEVIRERANSTNANKLIKVIKEPNQFCSVRNKNLVRVVEEAKTHSKFNKARAIVLGPKTDYTKGATYFWRKDVKPQKWMAGLIKTAEIENHVFYKE